MFRQGSVSTPKRLNFYTNNSIVVSVQFYFICMFTLSYISEHESSSYFGWEMLQLLIARVSEISLYCDTHMHRNLLELNFVIYCQFHEFFQTIFWYYVWQVYHQVLTLFHFLFMFWYSLISSHTLCSEITGKIRTSCPEAFGWHLKFCDIFLCLHKGPIHPHAEH
jgi:hypothetical protein